LVRQPLRAGITRKIGIFAEISHSQDAPQLQPKSPSSAQSNPDMRLGNNED
jgi:hypothetical protein